MTVNGVELPPKPVRRPDWRARLAAYMAQVAVTAFRPGRHDCALFAAGAIEAMTGVDIAAPWRGSYRSLAAGRKALADAGFASHVDVVARLFPETGPALAHVGDLAVLPSDVPDEPGALGVVQGAGVYALRPSGLVLLDRLTIERAFCV